ncbi:hypothetical protein F5146DRAFT_1220416 [Armillaria mellea]|nr:hypothetical protein F5146DRAFT_1231883 [Armillaria mellea]KAK0183564.1 hypothetical protein F5146DRAFT_1231285 [Armillaria mellea]KAK0184316.1 hypothetical protein F5146DRAFT_1228714 [Armillaria mellea]KAK0185855.1 hypothetical protein F5146DRAFT_1227514 [Armillaria mellea]KAK0195713.1 hypothetical protein F5146DRAFT_1220416 [Armillaria mellea]
MSSSRRLELRKGEDDVISGEVVGLVLLLSHHAEVSRLLASRGGISASKFDGDIRFHAHGPWSLVSIRSVSLKSKSTL